MGLVHTTVLGSDEFELTIDGEPAAIETLFEGFSEHDRLGIVIAADHGAAGAATLILATVTAFYDRLRATGETFFAYPDYFALHVGQPHGSLRKLDVFPDHKEIVVAADAESIVRALNDRAITRLWSRGGSHTPPSWSRRPEPAPNGGSARRWSTRGAGASCDPTSRSTGSERAESFVTAMLATNDAGLEAHAIRGGLRQPDGLPRGELPADQAARRARDAGRDQGLSRCRGHHHESAVALANRRGNIASNEFSEHCVQLEQRSRPMAATEPLIFDALRTPRGRGKVNGSLHATKPIDLVVGLMHEMLSRNPDLDPAGSTTSCSAASPRSATRAATSPRRRRSRRDFRTPCPACS